jgi:hypothetical protein
MSAPHGGGACWQDDIRSNDVAPEGVATQHTRRVDDSRRPPRCFFDNPPKAHGLMPREQGYSCDVKRRAIIEVNVPA